MIDGGYIRRFYVDVERKKELLRFFNIFQFMIKLSSGFGGPGWIEKNLIKEIFFIWLIHDIYE